MRTKIRVALIVLGLCLPLAAIVRPADAATTCHVNHMSITVVRTCYIDTSVPGARFTNGTVSWNYIDSLQQGGQGHVTGKLVDTATDNACATLKIAYAESEGATKTYVPVAQTCGKNSTANVDSRLGPARSGIYTVWLCSPEDTCTRLWRQVIEQHSP